MIIYGLGNNAEKYLQTKHNAGRLLVEQVAAQFGVNFSSKNGYTYAKKDDMWLVYSQGFMNESGLPLTNMVNFFKLAPDPNQILLIVHDDSDQTAGKVKLLQGGGSSGHHGINSIYKHLLGCNLTMDQVWRLKIGVRPARNTLKSETFVLNALTQSEKECIDKLKSILTGNTQLLYLDGISKLQTKINSL